MKKTTAMHLVSAIRKTATGNSTWVLPLAAALFLTGCAATRPVGDGFVLEAEHLAKEADARQSAGKPLVLLDLRPLDQYRSAHFTDSRWVDLTQWTRLSRSPDKGLEDEAGWRKRVGELGVSADDPLVVCDGGEMTEAARIWFILQNLGAKNVAILNGGWPALQASAPADRIVAGEPPAASEKDFGTADKGVFARARSPKVGRVDKKTVRSALGKTRRMIDTRTTAEYAGTERKNNPRAGHLPDAINIPHAQLLDPRGRLKPKAELWERFQAAGLERGQPLMIYCQSGGRAALTALAAARAGFSDVANYYMSFSEWSCDDSCPLAAAKAP
ncbi:MAG: rhodanese family protein [Planctomycetes bacterium]|nr:rhodanese family protein [Planctomycetota bacterium]